MQGIKKKMKKGEIRLVDLGPAGGRGGREQAGKRPALVMGSANGLVVTLPLTGNIRTARFSHTHPITPTNVNGLDRPSVVLVFQIISLDQNRFEGRKVIGRLAEGDMEAVDVLVKDLLGL